MRCNKLYAATSQSYFMFYILKSYVGAIIMLRCIKDIAVWMYRFARFDRQGWLEAHETILVPNLFF